MVDAFEQVEEEIRREQTTKFFRAVLPWFLGLFVLVIAVVGGWSWRQDAAQQRAYEADNQFRAALEDLRGADPAAGKAALEALVEDGPAGYAALSALQLAQAAATAGDYAEASRQYDLAADLSPRESLRHFAMLAAVFAKTNAGVAHTDIAPQVEALAQANPSMGHMAREALAAVAIEAGDYETARAELGLLQLQALENQGLAQRAAVLQAMLPPEADPAASPEAASSEAAAVDGAAEEPGASETDQDTAAPASPAEDEDSGANLE